MNLAEIQQLLDPLFPGLMGVTLVDVAPERVVAEMEVRADLCTTRGILHGGACMAFAETQLVLRPSEHRQTPPA